MLRARPRTARHSKPPSLLQIPANSTRPCIAAAHRMPPRSSAPADAIRGPPCVAGECADPHRTNTQYKFLRPDTDAEVLAKYGWAPWSCVCKEADCQRKAGWKAPAKTPGRQGKRPASDEDRLPDEPPRAQGFPVHKIEKSPRPAIFNEIYEIWASRCAFDG